jgi:hypothetical protein
MTTAAATDREAATTDAVRDLLKTIAALYLTATAIDPLEVAQARGLTEQSPSLHAIAKALDGVLWTFDLVQTSAGLRHPRTTRHRRFLSGGKETA